MSEITPKPFAFLPSLAEGIIKPADSQLLEQAYTRAQSILCGLDACPGGNALSQAEGIAQLAFQEIGLAGKALCALFAQRSIPQAHILRDFGPKVAGIAQGLDRLSKISFNQIDSNADNLIRLMLSEAADVRAILLLLAEKLYIIRNIKELDEASQQQHSLELRHLYAPIAHRLGLYRIKLEMEEAAMKYLEPEAYRSIADSLSQTKAARDAYIDAFIAPINKQLSGSSLSFTIKGRSKSISSIWGKIKNNGVSFEQVYDLFAIRIIIDCPREQEKDACWTAYSVVSNIYQPNTERLRDWVSHPRPNGYESLHSTVIGPEGRWVEVQIRSQRMDEIAEHGPAAHWLYKEKKAADNGLGWLGQIRQTLELKDSEIFEKEHISKISLYNDEIFAYTPNGELRKMRRGSTVLDFAYEVHSTLGNTCTGAKINGKIVPIKHELKNGDTVEIVTSKSQTPKRDWLSFAKTSKARQRIKKYLAECEYREAEAGKETIIRKLNQIKIKFDDFSVFRLIKHYKLKNALELYLLAASDKMDFSGWKELFAEERPDTSKQPEKINTANLEKRLSERSKASGSMLLIDDSSHDIAYRLAPCCNPIHGDEIFGFVSAKDGIKIHRANCPNANQLRDMYPYRVLAAAWMARAGKEQFVAGIRITGSDHAGVGTAITQLMAKDAQTVLRSMSVESVDGFFEGKLSIYVQDIQHLDSLLKKIRTLKGVHSAIRYDLVK